MTDPELVAKEFCSEATEGKSVWIAFMQGSYLAYPDKGINIIPLWSTERRCSEYIQAKYGGAEMNAVEVPLEVFISVWVKEADEEGWEYCLNKNNQEQGYVAVFPKELRSALCN